MKLLFLLTHLFINSLTDREITMYYDEIWNVCDEKGASFYRVFTLNDNNEIVGQVRDYYMTGELQWKGQMNYIDPKSNMNDEVFGLCTWYYRNGNKSS